MPHPDRLIPTPDPPSPKDISMTVEKATILGLFLAALFSIAAGIGFGGIAAAMCMDTGPDWVGPVVGLAAAVAAAWLGWQLGHWFTT